MGTTRWLNVYVVNVSNGTKCKIKTSFIPYKATKITGLRYQII